jgi:hypothetical protein
VLIFQPIALWQRLKPDFNMGGNRHPSTALRAGWKSYPVTKQDRMSLRKLDIHLPKSSWRIHLRANRAREKAA